ncbi:MAG: PHP domain-containing protein [Candidatus Omnitrophica bacterium]|nr:PHP domain-containing protein [Candidatus Omnitrophota bacterium]
MQKRVDLHVHTNFSDGTFSPKEVLSYASKIGLSCIAICDHDVIDGIPPAITLSETYNVEVIPGIELTAEKQGCEIHILGFYINWQDGQFQKKLAQLCRQRIKRMQDMLDKFKALGMPLNMDEVTGIDKEGSIGRLHLARALHKKGYTQTVDEAFKKYIANGKPCYSSKINLTPEEAIAEIIKVKGVPVLAHPAVMGKDDFISSYVKHGLMGIEVYHSDHNPLMTARYEKMAKDLGLLMTGGSDCHGLGKARILMGTTTVSYELVERLKNARR